jgi:hypothetical protein
MITPSIPWALVALSLWPALAAQSISGRVVGTNAVPLAGIVVDAGSGSSPVTTDALGAFTVAGLQSGNSYDVEFVPPFGAPWAARELAVTVTGAVQLGDVVLQPGFVVGGVAQTTAGQPIPGANINVYDQAGGKLFTPRDGTDALGAFAVVVPAGTWDVRVVPPVGALLVPKQLENVVVAAAVGLGVVTLPTAYLVTGSIVDLVSGVPVSQTRIKAYDALTGQRIHVPNELANTFGQFTLPLPYGIADLELEPPLGNTHVARQVFGVLVPGPTALGALRLQNGVLLSGTVTRNGAPAAGADIDVLLADGSKVFTPRDTVAAAGTFTVAVPAGVPLRVRAEPVAGTPFAGVVTAPFTLAGAGSVGTLALPGAVPVGGILTGAAGPEAGASLHFFTVPGNVPVVIAGATTNAAGSYTTHVPPGSYRVELRTAEASVSRPSEQLLTVAGATTLNATLPAKTVRCGVTSFGTPTLAPGQLLPINVFLHAMTPGLVTVRVDIVVELPNGSELSILSGLPIGLPPVPFTVDFVWVPIPTIPAVHLGRVLELVVRLRDATGAVVYDTGQTPFVVQ